MIKYLLNKLIEFKINECEQWTLSVTYILHVMLLNITKWNGMKFHLFLNDDEIEQILK